MKIKVVTRDWMPKNEIWFTNNDVPIDIFDQTIVEKNIKAGLIKKVKFITKFKKRRFGKLKGIK